METFSKIRTFFETFKKLTFWQRLFYFSEIRVLSFEAWEELTQLNELVKRSSEEKITARSESQLLQQERNALQRQVDEARQNLSKVELQLLGRITKLELELKHTTDLLRDKENKLQRFQQTLGQRETEHQSRLDKATAIHDMFEKQKRQLEDARIKELEETQEKQRHTWSEHENKVQMAVKRICAQHGIEYVTEFSFRGRPDNAIRVADDLIVFDAKSPAGFDLGNFKTYIRQQSEAAKKYAEHEGVRKDVYLVVPTNAVEVLDNLSFDLGTYRVYIITLDALEPVIVALQQIEAYAFVDQLSPEERQSICRVIGSLIYASKRRVQVDQFFNGHLLDLIRKIQTEIPESMQDEITRNEKAMKLNPPNDKRAKEISTDVLLKIHSQVEVHALSLDAPTPRMIELVNQ